MAKASSKKNTTGPHADVNQSSIPSDDDKPQGVQRKTKVPKTQAEKLKQLEKKVDKLNNRPRPI